MDYKTSKNAYSQVTLLIWLLALTVSGLGIQKTFADSLCQPSATTSPIGPCTATSTNGVSVSAVVIDPNAPPPPPPGGGGGGDVVFSDGGTLILQGRFAPNMSIAVVLSGALNQTVQTNAQGFFDARISNLKQGLYQISLTAFEIGNRSYETSTSLSLYVARKTETTASNIKFPPLYQSTANTFLFGEEIPFVTKSTPMTNFELFLNGKSHVSARTNVNGSFASTLKVRLPLGTHETMLREKNGSTTLPFGKKYIFTVVKSKNTIPKDGDSVGCPKKGDFNNDCKVNIVDFSLLAYWHKRSGFPAKYDLNNDTRITIRDFSILAFYWTG